MTCLKKYIPLFVLMLSGMGCADKDEIDCSPVLCVADEIIRLEVLLDGENALANGTWSEGEISVSGKTAEPLEIGVIREVQGSTLALLVIKSPEWGPGEFYYTLEFGDDWTIPLEVLFTVPKSNDPCCGDRLEILNLTSGEFPLEDNISYWTLRLN